MLATQVISRAKQIFALDIPLRALFESPTVAELARLIVQKQAEALSKDELTQLLTELENSQLLAEAQDQGIQPERKID